MFYFMIWKKVENCFYTFHITHFVCHCEHPHLKSITAVYLCVCSIKVLIYYRFVRHKMLPLKWQSLIPAKPLHKRDIVLVHFNHFHCMGICDKLSRHLSMLTYIYLDVDECWLTSSMSEQMFKLQISLNYGTI